MSTIAIYSNVLLDLLTNLPASAVITKNKMDGSRENFRQHEEILDCWLTGYWKGIPRRVSAGGAYCLHFEERNSCLWIGNYDGAKPEHNGKFSLIMNDVQAYEIVDFHQSDAAQNRLREIFMQPGPVGYSYYVSDVSKGSDTQHNVSRMAWVKQLVEQCSFRERVFELHGAQCRITGCRVRELLESENF